MIRKVDHVAIAVPDIAEALALFAGVFGGTFLNGGDDEGHGIRTVQLALPGLNVELIQPISDDSYLQGHLERRGPGLHHITMLVDDLEAAVGELVAADREVVDTDMEHDDWKETYIRPRSAFGTLLQIVETGVDSDTPVEGIELEDVLAGRVVWDGGRPRMRSERDRSA
jgi:methylmalonyl-CoA/ethylmalonyl-CoA epimerase